MLRIEQLLEEGDGDGLARPDVVRTLNPSIVPTQPMCANYSRSNKASEHQMLIRSRAAPSTNMLFGMWECTKLPLRTGSENTLEQ